MTQRQREKEEAASVRAYLKARLEQALIPVTPATPRERTGFTNVPISRRFRKGSQKTGEERFL